MNRNQNRPVTVSHHAKQRIDERLDLGRHKNAQEAAQAARYKGIPDTIITGEMKKWLDRAYYKNNSTKIRIYNNCVFVFGGDSGHARTLITVIPLRPDFVNKTEQYIGGYLQTA